jgi:hypothetical protein
MMCRATASARAWCRRTNASKSRWLPRGPARRVPSRPFEPRPPVGRDPLGPTNRPPAILPFQTKSCARSCCSAARSTATATGSRRSSCTA